MLLVQGEPRLTDGQAFTGKGKLVAASLLAGSNAATLRVYDGVNTSGKLMAVLGAAATLSDHWSLPNADAGVPFNTGLYLDISGTDPAGIVYFVT